MTETLPVSQQHGKADQEPLGTSDHLDSSFVYVSVFRQSGSLLIRTDQIAAAISGFFWPKIFFDFLTKNLDGAVKPVPILQVINLVMGLISLSYELPLGLLAGSRIQQSLEVRLFWLPLAVLGSILLYQATNPAIYYLVGTAVYFWAYTSGEIICAEPWTLPRRPERLKIMEGDKV